MCDALAPYNALPGVGIRAGVLVGQPNISSGKNLFKIAACWMAVVFPCDRSRHPNGCLLKKKACPYGDHVCFL
jgi:hypothetical protein